MRLRPQIGYLAEGNLCTSHHMKKRILTLFPNVKYLISAFTPGVKWFFWKVKNVASRWFFAKKMCHELRKKTKKYKNSSRKHPFSDNFWEVLHASSEKWNGSLRRFSDENVRSWPDSTAKPVLEADRSVERRQVWYGLHVVQVTGPCAWTIASNMFTDLVTYRPDRPLIT